MSMEECPFLSTVESDEECFKECVLYNYKNTGGNCPFRNIADYRASILDEGKSQIEFLEGEFDFIKKSYFKVQNQYL